MVLVGKPEGRRHYEDKWKSNIKMGSSEEGGGVLYSSG
jgi:hypothetical protein